MTQEFVAELISYIREYNKSALEGEDIRFYGFDMQRISYNFYWKIVWNLRLT